MGEYIQSLTISRGSLGELSGDIQDCLDDKLINKDEFQVLDELAGKTDYLFGKLIQSLTKKQKEGTWKIY